MNPAIRIFLTDDHAMVRSGMRLLLETQKDLAVVGEAGNAEDTHRGLAKTRPDVLLLDLTMPGSDAWTLMQRIRLDFPSVQIVVVTMHDESETRDRAFAEGCCEYVVKSLADVELLRTVRAVALNSGTTGTGPLSSATNFETDATPDPSQPLSLLSSREREVLILLGHGYTNQQIADELDVGIKSVESYRARMMRKLGIDNKIELVQRCIEWNLLD
jgi:two-component system response regulator NreC